jgi:hypothetical protein
MGRHGSPDATAGTGRPGAGGETEPGEGGRLGRAAGVEGAVVVPVIVPVLGVGIGVVTRLVNEGAGVRSWVVEGVAVEAVGVEAVAVEAVAVGAVGVAVVGTDGALDR